MVARRHNPWAPATLPERDAVQTLDYFQCPRVFVPPNDKRLGNDKMYMPADDTIKDFCSD
eukprot:COSAG02_NODE_44311_length_367_cov_0.951493_1_plen_59_part_10